MRSLKGRTFIIAEMSANHGGSLEIAERTIFAIAESGADAVKVQTYRPESLSLNVDNEYFGPKKEGAWKGIRPWDLYRDAAMPYEWQPRLKALAEELGLVFFSSPFDLEGVDFLEALDVPCYKIASFEITDIPLIRKAASTGKPIIISTGVAGLDDIRLAIDTCHAAGNSAITLLKCTSEYPAKIAAANLNTLPDMAARFGVSVGVSDHTEGSLIPVLAVALGACMVEKHFILSRAQGGADSAFSMEPHEFAEMVNSVRAAESALGRVDYSVSEKDALRRRSLFWVKDIHCGEQITAEHLCSLRPGHGLPPVCLQEVLGLVAARDIYRGEPLKWCDACHATES
jgi:pseudaminic acid synthase